VTRRAIPAEIDRRVREAAHHRCGYCLSPQRLVMARLEVEHIIPLAKGGTDDEANLWLACPICNGHKSDKTEAVDAETGVTVPLFNPRTQRWTDHFVWSGDGIRIIGTTPLDGRPSPHCISATIPMHSKCASTGFWLVGIRRLVRTEGRVMKAER
jgi:hypothetical protein